MYSDMVRNKYRIAQIAVLAVLERSATLTKPHIGDNVQMLSYFKSLSTVYKILASLPEVRGFKVPELGMSVVALNQMLPHLKFLYLGGQAERVSSYHDVHFPTEWCRLKPSVSDPEGPAPRTAASIRKLVLEESITIERML